MIQKALSFFAASCTPKANAGGFFGLPHWYEYLQGETDPISGKCIPKINNWSDLWAIALAVVDILLVIGGLVAVVFVIYGGFQYITSQGEPDKTAAAKSTITNAIVGLVIILLAIGIVSFIGNKF
jgi:hypothetical protein